MNAQLALTLANQYNIQNDHHLANSFDHEDRVAMIQSGRKRSRHLRQSMAEVYQERRRNEDPNPAPRMNRYGYDGPNRHQFGGNKINTRQIFKPAVQRTTLPADAVCTLTSALPHTLPFFAKPQPQQQQLFTPEQQYQFFSQQCKPRQQQQQRPPGQRHFLRGDLHSTLWS